MTTTATTNDNEKIIKKPLIDEDIEMPMASDQIADETEEDFAELFRNRNIKTKEADAIRAAREQEEAEDEDERLERCELEKARKNRIRLRKRATAMTGSIIAMLVIGIYISIAITMEMIGVIGLIAAIAHLGVAVVLIWVGIWIHRFIKHEIYSNL